MYRLLALLSFSFGYSILLAAPATPEPEPPRKRPADLRRQQEALNFGQQLMFVFNEVGQNYVRPVPRAELAHAALAGLYEAARLPIPSTLRAEVEKAKSESELLDLLIRSREAVGNLEPLQGMGDLLVAVRGMTRALDPHSGVVSGEELRRGSGVATVPRVGLELENGAGGPVTVKAVHLGGPAQRAGIRPGDQITHIDGKPPGSNVLILTGLQAYPPEVQPGVPVPVLGAVTLTLEREGLKEPWKVKVEPSQFRPETVLGVSRQDSNAWEYWIDRKRKLGYARVATLDNGTAAELRQVVGKLKAEGLAGLLLDLRWCPGGFLNEAVDVAQIFLGECTVATVKNRSQGDDTYRSVRDEGKLLDVPMIVLVNAETSGGAELIAAALQDNGRAALAGQRTRGKASIQTTTGLPIPNMGLKLTSGTFFRPNGKNLHRFPDSKPGDDWGVRPDAKLECRVSADLNRQLRDWWLLHAIRPGPSREALPVDDPRTDPQRYAALQALVEQAK